MRILVTGANGQVGHELLRALVSQDASTPTLPRLRGRETSAQREWVGGMRSDALDAEEASIVPTTRNGMLDDGSRCERIDLADLEGLTAALDRIAPHLIVNAAAYTAVDRAEDEPGLAQRINGDAVGVLGAWAERHHARVLHYSTDYVFDGSATRPYREDAATHPLGVYGRSKLAGEIALRGSGARHLILRTAWVYAARGRNFLLTMLRLGAERDELRVVDDQVGAPTPAGLIADATAQVIAQWCGDETSKYDGTYHLVASGHTSWCGFARAIFERAQRAGLIERVPRVTAIRTADYPTKAARPAFSVLDTTRLRDTFGIALPDWQAALDEAIADLAAK
ncbi:MAG: dTDP-4-dehydrorhamnose reductase [Xanthomonadales bacterium]|nr:dTDP-4-dehydrorhamnose reductase [Xanthomonadales bacterium]